MVLSAISPRTPTLIGTSRQASTESPCAARHCVERRFGARSRLRAETASLRRASDSAVSVMPVAASRRSRGTPVMRPTPSLLLPSEATAPRWASRASAVSACCEDGVAGLGADGRDKADAAGVVVEPRVDQAALTARSRRAEWAAIRLTSSVQTGRRRPWFTQPWEATLTRRPPHLSETKSLATDEANTGA